MKNKSESERKKKQQQQHIEYGISFSHPKIYDEKNDDREIQSKRNNSTKFYQKLIACNAGENIEILMGIGDRNVTLKMKF